MRLLLKDRWGEPADFVFMDLLLGFLEVGGEKSLHLALEK